MKITYRNLLVSDVYVITRQCSPSTITNLIRRCMVFEIMTPGPKISLVDMTGRILKKKPSRQKARNANLVDCSIILVNVAEILMPYHLQSKSTRDKSMTKRAQVTSLHGQSVHQDRMTGRSPT
jgi:predicted RNase H-like nuclease